MLRDHLVCGVSDENIQKRLLAEPKLTLESALHLAYLLRVLVATLKF